MIKAILNAVFTIIGITLIVTSIGWQPLFGIMCILAGYVSKYEIEKLLKNVV